MHIEQEVGLLQVKEVPQLRRQAEVLQADLNVAKAQVEDLKTRYASERGQRRMLHEHLQVCAAPGSPFDWPNVRCCMESTIFQDSMPDRGQLCIDVQCVS